LECSEVKAFFIVAGSSQALTFNGQPTLLRNGEKMSFTWKCHLAAWM
jgi:hypothetical protein